MLNVKLLMDYKTIQQIRESGKDAEIAEISIDLNSTIETENFLLNNIEVVFLINYNNSNKNIYCVELLNGHEEKTMNGWENILDMLIKTTCNADVVKILLDTLNIWNNDFIRVLHSSGEPSGNNFQEIKKTEVFKMINTINTRYKKDIEAITSEIINNYRLETELLKIGIPSICHKENKNCISLRKNFWYFSGAVKKLYAKIDDDTEMMETYKNELAQWSSNLKDKIQDVICQNLINYYGIEA